MDKEYGETQESIASQISLIRHKCLDPTRRVYGAVNRIVPPTPSSSLVRNAARHGTIVCKGSSQISLILKVIIFQVVTFLPSLTRSCLQESMQPMQTMSTMVWMDGPAASVLALLSQLPNQLLL